MTMSAQPWRCLLLASLMKLLFKLVEIEFSLLSPEHFYWKNISENAPAEANYDGLCSYELRKADRPTAIQLTTSWLYSARYLIPVLGGLVSSAWLGCVRVLQIGGAVMLLSTVLLAVSVHLGLMCQDSPITIITWLLLPVFYGLNQPNILMALFCWHRRGRLCTAVTAAYCAIAAIGDLVSAAFVCEHFPRTSVLRNFTLAFVAISLAYQLLASFIPQVPEEGLFELPSKQRLMKYFQIFSALIPIFAVLNDARSAISLSEMSFFMRETVDTTERPWLSPSWVRDVTLVVTAPLLILIAAMSGRRLPVAPRMLSGILLKCAVELSLLIVTSVGLTHVTTTASVYIITFILNGVAQLLVTVATYDLGCLLLPGNAQALLLGIIFTVWGLAIFVSAGLLRVSKQLNNFQNGSKPLFFVYHLIALLLLSAGFLYQKFVTLPMADRMAELSEEAELDAAADEQLEDDPDNENSNPELRSILD